MNTVADTPGRVRTWMRRPVFWVAVAAFVAVVAFVFYWFAPQSLLFDQVVDDEFPIASPATDDDDAVADSESDASEGSEGTSDDAMADDAMAEEDAMADAAEQEAEPAAGGPVALSSGMFESRGRYSGVGTATIYELEDGRRTLRLEDFETTNGPDLFVWLSGATSADPDEAHDVVYYNLGDLRGNVGNQNYEIPDDVNLDDYASVIIWCERFSTGFAAADLLEL